MSKKSFQIKESIRGFDLKFKTTHGLFSYQKVDVGTRLLINNLEVQRDESCLDLGCGYGVLGIAMAKLSGGVKLVS